MGRHGGWMELEGGQGRPWPPSRKPRRCWKAAKAAKTANVLVTYVTELTIMTGAEGARLARSTGLRARGWAGGEPGSDWKRAKKTIGPLPGSRTGAGRGPRGPR